MDILDVQGDPNLLGQHFKQGEWGNWRRILRALYALPPQRGDRELFEEVSGRKTWPKAPAFESWLIAGRRSGKTRIAALIATYEACFRDYTGLARGTRPRVLLVSPTQDQSRTAFEYIEALICDTPLLAQMVVRRTRSEIELTNSVEIKVSVANFRSVRSFTAACVVLDEVAYLRDERSATPDVELIRALAPTLVTLPHARLVALTSPYGRFGIAWEKYRRHFGRDDSNTLVLQAPTVLLNPTINRERLQQRYEEDPIEAASEFEAQFRQDLEQLFSVDALQACVEPGVTRRLPIDGLGYQGFVDPSGGGADEFSVAVAHRDKDRNTTVLDCVDAWKGSPAASVKKAAELLKAYNLRRVTGDAYAAGFVVDAFAAEGIAYERSTRNRSEIYLETLPLVNAGRIDLLDEDRLLTQLQLLERRTGRSGKDAVDHPRGAHDDRANAAAGAIVGASRDCFQIVAPVEVGLRPCPFRMEGFV